MVKGLLELEVAVRLQKPVHEGIAEDEAEDGFDLKQTRSVK